MLQCLQDIKRRSRILNPQCMVQTLACRPLLVHLVTRPLGMALVPATLIKQRTQLSSQTLYPAPFAGLSSPIIYNEEASLIQTVSCKQETNQETTNPTHSIRTRILILTIRLWTCIPIAHLMNPIECLLS